MEEDAGIAIAFDVLGNLLREWDELDGEERYGRLCAVRGYLVGFYGDELLEATDIPASWSPGDGSNAGAETKQ